MAVVANGVGAGYRHEVFKGSHSGGPSELCRVTTANPVKRPCVISMPSNMDVTGF